MTENEDATTTANVVETLAGRLGQHQFFGTPVQQGTTTLVPVAYVRAGGGLGGRGKRGPDRPNGGVGFVARPIGAWSISDDGSVGWHPAVNINRIVWGGQLAAATVAVTVLLARRHCSRGKVFGRR